MQVKVTYCSRYNGVVIEINGEYVDSYKNPKAEAVIDAVVDFGANKCSDDGEYYGDINDLEEVAMRIVHEVYGADVDFAFEEDSVSS